MSLLKRVDNVCRSKSWSEGYFSKVAAGDMGAVKRLRETGRITLRNVARIESYLAELDA
ncbi:MAG: hypothetical protein AAF755_10185 [Pseudomonadota bacterium]